MRQIFFLVLLFITTGLFAQAPSNYTNINGRYRWIAGMFDSTFHIPKGTTTSLRTGGSTNAGALFYRTTDSSVYYYTGTQWLKVAGAAGFVPYTGATQNVNLGQFGVTTKFVQFDTSSQAVTDRRLQWSNAEGTLQFGMTNGSTITQRIGLEQFARVRNLQGDTIEAGDVVYISGASGDRAAVKLADNRADSTSSKTLGVATEQILPNDVGLVGTFGVVGKLNLSAFTAGDVVYLDSIPGKLTKVKPQAPYHMVFVGVVERANAGNGLLFVNVQNGYELEELHNVRITSPVRNNAILAYDSVGRLWKDTTLNAIGGITGSGTSGQVSYFNGTNSITGSNNLFWDNANSRLGVGGSPGAFTLDITGTGRASTTFEIGTSTIWQRFNNNSISYFSQGSYFNTLSTNGPGTLNYVNSTSGNTIFSFLNNATLRINTIQSGAVGGVTYSQLALDGNLFGISTTTPAITNRVFTTSGSGITVQRLNLYNGDAGKIEMQPTGGNVLIGTTTDAGFRLDVNGTARVQNTLTVGASNLIGTEQAIISNSATQQLRLYNSSITSGAQAQLTLSTNTNGVVSSAISAVSLDNSGNQTLSFFTSNAGTTAERLRIYNTGNTVIQNGGTFTDAGFRLDVNGTARVQDNVTISQTTTGGVALSVTTPSGGANIMRLLRTGNIQADLTTVGSNAFQWSASWYYTGGVTIGVAPSTAVPTASWLQVNSGISIGNTLNGWNASAILDVNSSNRGFLKPRMTTANRDAISTPATGLSVYNTSTNTNDYYNGSAWLNVGQVLVPANNTTGFTISGSSLTGSNAQSLVSLSQTWNTTGNPTAIKLDVTNTASGNNSYLLDLQVGGIPQFTVFKGGEIKTSSPAGGVAQTWKLGSVHAVTPTSPDRTIEVEVNGTTYYLHAKTTNN